MADKFIDPLSEEGRALSSQAPVSGQTSSRFVDPITAGMTQRVDPQKPLDDVVEFDADLPEFPALSFKLKERFPIEAGTMFTAEEDEKIRIIQKHAPEAKILRDTEGNTVVELRGRRAFLNKPGVSGQDLAAFAGQAAAFTVGGRAAGVGKKGIGLGQRFARGALGAGGTDVALQGSVSALGGGEGIDPLQTAVVSATGGVAEILVPAIATSIRNSRGTFVTGGGELTQEGLEALASTNIPAPDLIEELNKQLIKQGQKTIDVPAAQLATMARIQSQTGRVPTPVPVPVNQPTVSGRIVEDLSAVRAGTRAEREALEREFLQDTQGRLTEGQRSASVPQLAREERLRASQGSAGNALRQQEQNLEEGLLQAQQNIRQQASRELDGIPATENEAFGEVAESVAERASALRNEISQAYDRVSNTNLTLKSNQPVVDLGRRLQATIRSERDAGNVISQDVTPKAFIAQREIKDLVSTFENTQNIKPLDLKQIEAKRKQLENLRRSAAPGSPDQVVLGKLKGEFDAWLDDSIDASLFSGDIEAIELLKQARTLRSTQAELFERVRLPGSAGVDRQVSNIMERLARPTSGEAATAGEAMNLIFGMGQLGAKQASVKTVRHLKNVFGAESVEFQNLRQAALMRMFANSMRGGEFKPQTFVSQMDNTLGDKGIDLVRELFSPEEIAQLQRYRNLVKTSVPPKRVANTSNTFNSWFRLMQETVPTALIVGGAGGAGITGVPEDLGDLGPAAALVLGLAFKSVPFRNAATATRPLVEQGVRQSVRADEVQGAIVTEGRRRIDESRAEEF